MSIIFRAALIAPPFSCLLLGGIMVEETRHGGWPRKEPEKTAGASERLFARALLVERQEAILGALAEKAAAGDVHVAAFLFDRLYGRPAAAPTRTLSVPNEESPYDLRKLDDEELATLSHLLDKCMPDGFEATP